MKVSGGGVFGDTQQAGEHRVLGMFRGETWHVKEEKSELVMENSFRGQSKPSSPSHSDNLILMG